MARPKRPVQSNMWAPTPHLFLATSCVLVAFLQWPKRWLIAGAPILTWFLIFSAKKGQRVFPSVNLWAMLATINLLYAISATSWLLYWVFAGCCYFIILALCLSHFQLFANMVRRGFRTLNKTIHFTDDKIALFGLPSLTIDTDVDGLMVVRGITMSLSTLTCVVHGVEVALKLEDGVELSILTETVTIALFRSIKVGNVYANIKGAAGESNFAFLDEHNQEQDENALTPSYQDEKTSPRASLKRDASYVLTGGAPQEHVSPKEGLKSTTILSSNEEDAGRLYSEALERIDQLSAIAQSEKLVKQRISRKRNSDVDLNDMHEVRAAVCSQLHSKVSVPDPPPTSVKVTTLQTLSPPRVRRFLHRLPMLLRLLLNMLSSAHTIEIASVTAAGSGRWIQQLFNENLFKHYVDEISGLQDLQKKISNWLLDANFVISISNITAHARVPFLPDFDITNYFNLGVINMYRSLPMQLELRQVMRIFGADVTVSLPAFLLPHHEHLLPLKPTTEEKLEYEKEGKIVIETPNTSATEQDLEQMEEDVTHFTTSFHLSLPVIFDQQLLNFVAALIKASKVIEIEKDSSAFDGEVHGIKEFSHALRDDMKDSMKKLTIDIVASDTWIAKLVGKALKTLETANGDIGYSHNFPIPLKPYRDATESASKLLG